MNHAWLNFIPLILRNKIKERHDLPKILENTGWLFADKVVRLGIGFFINIWVARYLGPDDFGLLSYSQSFVFLFNAITTLGLDTIVIRELVRNENNRDMLLGTTFLLKAAGAALTLLLLAVSIQFTHNSSYNNWLIFIIAAASFFQSFNVIDSYFQSIMASKYTGYANVFSLLTASLVKIALILYKASLLAFAVVSIVEGFLLALFLTLLYLKRRNGILNWKYSYKMAATMLKHSWPLIISGLAVSFGMRIDQILLKNMLGAQDVGIYAASVNLAEPLSFIGVIAAQGVFPYMAANRSREELNNSLVYFTRYTFIAMASSALAVMLFSNKIIYYTFGSTYNSSQILLNMLIWAPCFSFMSIVSNIYYVFNNMTRVIAVRQVMVLLFNITMNIVLINKYGAIGAAVTTLLSDLLLAYFIELFSKETREILYIKLKAIFFVKFVSEN